MKWDESKHPRDKDGKFKSIREYVKWTIEDLKQVAREQLSERAKSVEVTPITDEAIAKVPVVYIPGYTEEECKFIAEQNKELLRYARDNNSHNEVAFVFREGFKDKLILKGKSDNIDFGYALQGKGEGIVILHNHPRNHTFSFDDLFTFARADGVKTMSLVKNNGTVEIITKHAGFDSNRFITQLSRNFKKYNKTHTVKEQEKAVIATLSKGDGGVIWKE